MNDATEIVSLPRIALPTTAYVTSTEVLLRGWTHPNIKSYLGAPDRKIKAKNRDPEQVQTRRSLLIKLYEAHRVEQAEQAAPLREQLRTRRAGPFRIVFDRLTTSLHYAKTVAIQLEPMPEERLRERACAEFNRRVRNHETTGWAAAEDLTSPFVARLCVNYVRHRCFGYEAELRRLSKDGIGVYSGAYFTLKGRILAEVAAQYPRLQRECERQSGIL